MEIVTQGDPAPVKRNRRWKNPVGVELTLLLTISGRCPARANAERLALVLNGLLNILDHYETDKVDFTYARWRKFFPWLTDRQVEHAFEDLETMGYVVKNRHRDGCWFYATDLCFDDQGTQSPGGGGTDPRSRGDESTESLTDLKNKTPEQPSPAVPAPKRKPKAITAKMEQLRPLAQEAFRLLAENCSRQGVQPPKNLTEDQIIVQVDALHRLDHIEARDFLPTLRFALEDEFWNDKIDSPAAWREIGSGKTSKWYKIHKKWKAAGSPGGVQQPPPPTPKFVVHPRDLEDMGYEP